MRKIYASLLVCLIATTAPVQLLAQEEEDSTTFIEGLIQDALSGTSREVTVTGFTGALSSNATMDKLTIADAEGIWLTIEDASLVWSRLALLRGRLQVEELTAGHIELVRIPKAEAKPPSPKDAEVQPFTLPDLPVSIEIDTLRADNLDLGADILGEAAKLMLNGKMYLIDGQADVALNVQRLDHDDTLSLDAGFDNVTRILRIDLDFEEDEGGLAARALNVPGLPALGLQIKGNAPLSQFEADIALSSDGVERFGGTVGISAAVDAPPGALQFSVDLDGDLRPLVAQELHPFFGEIARLKANGKTLAEGGMALDALNLTSGALSLSGSFNTTPTGWPDHFALDGRIAGDGPLRLPTNSPPILVEEVSLSASYSLQEGDGWAADVSLTGLERDGLRLGHAGLTGSGTIEHGETRGLTVDTVFRVEDLSHTDLGLQRAIGTSPEGDLSFFWREGAPIEIRNLALRLNETELLANGQMEGLSGGFPVTGNLALTSPDISRFAAVAGRALSGAVNMNVVGSGIPLTGAFDVSLNGTMTDLVIGEARVDPLLEGRSTLTLTTQRDENGIVIDRLKIDNDALTADASARLNGQSGALTLSGRINDLSLADPTLSGPANVDTDVTWQSTGTLDLTRLELDAAGARVSASGSVDTKDPTLPATGQLALRAPDISRLAGVVKMPLAGQVDLNVTGNGSLKGATVDGSISLNASGLTTGITTVDEVSGGEVALEAVLAYGDGVPFVDVLSLETKNLQAKAESAEPGAPISIDAKLTDLGLVAPGINGPAEFEGTITPRDTRGEVLDVQLGFAGPAGVSADIEGQVADYGQTLDLSIKGAAPLELANKALSPNSIAGSVNFDLRVDGPPALGALNGQAVFQNARLAIPAANMALTGLGGTVMIAGGQVTPDISGSAGSGGQFRVSGPISLAAPFQSNLAVELTNLVVADPTLYLTTVNGTVTVNGPLTGGANIGGAVNLGRTELRVPSGGASAYGVPENIRHIAEPPAVRRTRIRAGLVQSDQKSGPRVAFPIDLSISAPNQIFVRGRGIDAELGGEMRLGGTTANITASGLFELIRGRIDVLTKRIDLTEGLIDLRGALDPYIRFVAQTQSNDYSINIMVEGLASEPEVTFSSSPDLPEEEVIAQLLFGTSFSNMSAFQAAQLVSAVATLSGQGGDSLTGRLRQGLGLSDLDVTSTDDGGTEVSAGAYISDNIYSEIVADSEGNNKVNINLDLSDSLTVKGSADNEGNTGVGIFFEKDY